MKIPYFCCIGAELKRYAKDFDFMNQVYLYKVPTDDSIEEVLAQDYFQAISDTVLQDDLVYIYEASAETLHSCRFDKQNGHITAVPLASDETLTGAVTTIIHDNLTPNKLLKSDENGKVAASDLNEDEIANTDLSNLTAKGKNISNWSSNVSNCITEIPQNINLTLSNGTLTLKAGSKVYIPNGVGVFDEITVPADRTLTSGATWQFMVLYNKTSGDFYRNTDMAHQYSGNTAPENPTNQTIWYDTANNLVKMYLNGAWTSDWSFPLALVTATGSISSINQVFNGFGYIGSVVYALPGVKYLRANGRNSDGTLKSTLSTISSVRTVSASGTYSNLPIILGGSAMVLLFMTYDEKANKIGSGEALTIAGKINVSSGAITGLSVKTAFHAVDYSDSDYIANCAMPSTEYTDLTWAASGTVYTMPADGYLMGRRTSTASGQYLFCYKESNSFTLYSGWASGAGQGWAFFIPVSKGDKILINYDMPTGVSLRFFYANGAK